MYTGKAYDLGRGERSSPTEGIPQKTPGPGAHDVKREFEKREGDVQGGFE